MFQPQAKGDQNMAILDGILGGDSSQTSASSDSFESMIGTSPAFGLQASDVLHTESHDDDGDHSSFTGIGDLGVGFAAPTFIGVSSSSDQFSQSETDSDNGGLLGGLL
jgi:hypothetical protein